MLTRDPFAELELVLDAKRTALAERKARTPIEAIRAIASLQRRPEPLLCTVTGGSSVTLLGAICYHSRSTYDPVSLALRYMRAELDGLSLCTDEMINGQPYQGGVSDLALVTRAVRAPVLWHDYVLDEYQIVEARAAGAAAVALNSRYVDSQTLRGLISVTQRNRMSAVVNVHDLESLTEALSFSPPVIALGSRHPDGSLHIEQMNYLRIHVPSHIRVMIAPSLQTFDEARAVAALNPDAVLIDETLLDHLEATDTLRSIFCN